MTETSDTVGQRIDALGVTAELPPDVLVSDAVVLLECVYPDGAVTLYLAQSESMSWIKKIGMLTAARTIEDANYRDVDD